MRCAPPVRHDEFMTIPDEARRSAIDQAMASLAAGDGAHAIYHDDAVLEFPQSGERFEGLSNFKEWREQYPSDVRFEVRRISGSGDVWVRELSVSYDGGLPMLGIAVLGPRPSNVYPSTSSARPRVTPTADDSAAVSGT
jgi:hypothetical protein